MMEGQRFPSPRQELVWMSLAGVFPFVVYLPTVAPTYCFLSDSGDFVTASALLTLAHPPGYPWFCLLGKLFSVLIPFGEEIWRIHLLGPTFVALTGAITYRLAREFLSEPLFPLLTAWTVAFGPVLWFSSVAAEVYGANLFLTILGLYALVRFWRTGDKRWFYTVGLTIGFGATHHLTLPLIAVGGLFGMFLAWRWLPQRPSPRDFLIASLFASLPLSLYAYLPLRSPKPYGYRYWQLTGDDPAKSVRDFFRFITAQRYRRFMGAIHLLPRRLHQWVRWGWRQFRFFFLIGLLFVWVIGRTEKAFGATTLGMGLIHMAFYSTYAVPDINDFFIPSWTLTVLWGGIVMGRALKSFQQRGYPLAAFTLLLIACVNTELTALEGLHLAFNPDPYKGHRYLEGVLRHTPKNAALVVLADDVLFNLWVMQGIEGKRKDVLVLATYQWHPLLPLTRPVVTVTGELAQFFRSPFWHLKPTSPWTARVTGTPPLIPLRPVSCHPRHPFFVHQFLLRPPPEGVHVGSLLFAVAEVCVKLGEEREWGILALFAPKDGKVRWTSWHPFPSKTKMIAERKGHWLFRWEICLSVPSTIPPEDYTIRILPLLKKALPALKDHHHLWEKARPLRTLSFWGR